MVLPGDWIEMPSADADGNVVEISQITVKVQNWDNTITTIPAYDMITKPLKNWRGMSEAGVRRMKRSLNIDMTSIQHCRQETLAQFKNNPFLGEYITKIENDIAQNSANSETSADTDKLYPTNLSLYCYYLQRFLEKNPMISQDFTLMVRQLQSTNLGMPIEIYAFIKTTNWFEFEQIQAEIINYVVISVSAFDLRIYQTPAWHDYHKK
jgi:miniconductance mechanosensitive channel